MAAGGGMASGMGSLPRTPQSAPPNFYSQAGQQAAAGAGAGQQAGPGQQSASPAQGSDKEADHEFLEGVTKILTLLDKMKTLKPKGADVTKYTKACAQVMKDCVKQVFSGGDDVPGGSAPGAESGTSPADPGSTGPPAPAAASSPSASASAAPAGAGSAS